MKPTNHLITASIALIINLVGSASIMAQAVPASPPKATTSLVAVIIDDQTGVELSRDHGIEPLTLQDMETLIKAVLLGQKPVRLLHLAVDEDATDNRVARLEFKPFKGKRPQAPSRALPLRLLQEKVMKYKKDRAEWQRGILTYQKKLKTSADGFMRQIMDTQMEVSERFDEMLAARNGQDFNRSDIVGCVTAANRLLEGSPRKVIVLNTDAKDLPAKRAPRLSPLTVKELDPAVEIILVNTSQLPEQELIFKGIPNPMHHADSIEEAMELIVKMLGEKKTEATKAQAVKTSQSEAGGEE